MEFFFSFGGFSAYAVLHSLLASTRVKSAVRKRMGDPAGHNFRLFYNAIAVISLVPVLLLVAAFPGETIYSFPPIGMAIGLTVQSAVLLLAAITFLQSNPGSFLGISQWLGPRQDSGLSTTGFYRHLRHPLYTLGIVFIWSTPFMTSGLAGLFIAISIYFFVGAELEEKRMIEEFGDAYRAYQRRTKRLIPFLY